MNKIKLQLGLITLFVLLAAFSRCLPHIWNCRPDRPADAGDANRNRVMRRVGGIDPQVGDIRVRARLQHRADIDGRAGIIYHRNHVGDQRNIIGQIKPPGGRNSVGALQSDQQRQLIRRGDLLAAYLRHALADKNRGNDGCGDIRTDRSA